MLSFLNTFKTEIFVTTVIIIHYVLYILIYLNINLISLHYVNILNALLQVSISLFLIFRFVFKKQNSIISSFDKRVIITCSTFVLLNVITNYFFQSKSNNEKSSSNTIPSGHNGHNGHNAHNGEQHNVHNGQKTMDINPVTHNNVDESFYIMPNPPPEYINGPLNLDGNTNTFTTNHNVYEYLPIQSKINIANAV